MKHLTGLIILIFSPILILSQAVTGTSIVIIPDSTTEIKNYEFNNRKDIKKVVISGSVRVIGEMAFRECSNLEEVVLNEGTEEIARGAFSSALKLKEIKIPASVVRFGYEPFHPSITLTCYAGSPAHQFAVDEHYTFNLIGTTSVTLIRKPYRTPEEVEELLGIRKSISFKVADQRAAASYPVGATGQAGGTVFYSNSGIAMEFIKLQEDLSWDDALAAVNELNKKNYNDWNLPTKGEIQWIYDTFGQKKNPILESIRYWSSTPDGKENTPYVWFHDFTNGKTYHNNMRGKSALHGVIAVRTFVYDRRNSGEGGGIIIQSLPDGSYIEMSPLLGYYNWYEAGTAAEVYRGADHDDWRLPNIAELEWIYQSLSKDNKLPLAPDQYWSAAYEGEKYDDPAWYFDFARGRSYSRFRHGRERYMAVRVVRLHGKGFTTRVENGILYPGAGIKTITRLPFTNENTSITAVIIPDGTESIAYRAFDRLGNIQSIYIPSSVTVIADRAFHKNSILTVEKKSAAHKWAKDNGFDYRFIGGSSDDKIEVLFNPMLKTAWKPGGLYRSKLEPGMTLPCGKISIAQILFHHKLQPSNMKVNMGHVMPVITDDASTAGIEATAAYLYAVSSGYEHFSFRRENHYYDKEKLPRDKFNEIVLNELRAGRPLQLHAKNASSDHAMVIDGARIKNGVLQFHLNFGWEWLHDGWFDIWEPINTFMINMDLPYRRISVIIPET